MRPIFGAMSLLCPFLCRLCQIYPLYYMQYPKRSYREKHPVSGHTMLTNNQAAIRASTFIEKRYCDVVLVKKPGTHRDERKQHVFGAP
jgi:hypothetical protein